MKSSKKKILFCVTGMSPAVVTETLYALTQQKNFVPDEIHIVTTINGKNKLMRDLLGIEGGRSISVGAFHQFCNEYKLLNIVFNEANIHLIQEHDGSYLSDIQTPEQNILAADTIVGMIGKFCRSENCDELHVSIAGGRKTMGFFAGYALSLYGREKDSLSHVLVEPQYELVQNFFYPTKHDEILVDQSGNEVNAKLAKVMLAEIPWVRLGLGWPKTLLANDITYSESIRRAQANISPPKLQFLNDLTHEKDIKCNGELISLSPKGFSFLFLMAFYTTKNREFNFRNWEKIKQDYLKIYKYKFGDKKGVTLDKRISDCDDLRKVFSECRNSIKKSLEERFSSIDNSHFCLPQVEVKGYSYKLNIDQNNIIFSDEDTNFINNNLL